MKAGFQEEINIPNLRRALLRHELFEVPEKLADPGEPDIL